MATKRFEATKTHPIGDMIVTIRDHKVILDRDLAALYGVPTFRFNEAVKRNRRRFPDDFMFQLTAKELAALTSQIAMSKTGRGGRRTLPYAFTEHGAVMAANILRSEKAIQMSSLSCARSSRFAPCSRPKRTWPANWLL